MFSLFLFACVCMHMCVHVFAPQHKCGGHRTTWSVLPSTSMCILENEQSGEVWWKAPQSTEHFAAPQFLFGLNYQQMINLF